MKLEKTSVLKATTNFGHNSSKPLLQQLESHNLFIDEAALQGLTNSSIRATLGNSVYDKECSGVFELDSGKVLKFYKAIPPCPSGPWDTPTLKRKAFSKPTDRGIETKGYLLTEKVIELNRYGIDNPSDRRYNPSLCKSIREFETFMQAMGYTLHDGFQVGLVDNLNGKRQQLAVYDPGTVIPLRGKPYEHFMVTSIPESIATEVEKRRPVLEKAAKLCKKLEYYSDPQIDVKNPDYKETFAELNKLIQQEQLETLIPDHYLKRLHPDKNIRQAKVSLSHLQANYLPALDIAPLSVAKTPNRKRWTIAQPTAGVYLNLSKEEYRALPEQARENLNYIRKLLKENNSRMQTLLQRNALVIYPDHVLVVPRTDKQSDYPLSTWARRYYFNRQNTEPGLTIPALKSLLKKEAAHQILNYMG